MGDWTGALEGAGASAGAGDTSELDRVVELAQSDAAPAPVNGEGPASPGARRRGLSDLGRAPRADVWSGRKLKNAKITELRRYITDELYPRIPEPGEETGHEVAPEQRAALLQQALAGSAHMAMGIAAKVYGSPSLAISPEEAGELAGYWTPLALPYYDQIMQGLPWAVAITGTWRVMAPHVDAAARERAQLRGRSATGSGPLDAVSDADSGE